MHSDETGRFTRQPRTFWQRHALTIITIVMGLLFALVIVVQVTT